MIIVPNSEEQMELLEKLKNSDKYEDKCMVTALECLMHDDSVGHSKYTIGETVELLKKTHACTEEYANRVVLRIIGDGWRVY